ncbi:MAG: aminopeptidase P family protein [Dehalococcoidales bacterium]|nr:aminopeptidase P family protein [Dehalococcoidales bacterium]
MISNIANRLQKLRRKLEGKEVDGIFISQPENRYYLSNFLGTAGYLLITRHDAVLATDFRYTEQAGIQSPEYRIFQITGSSLDWFVQLVAGLKIKRLGFESGNITFAFHGKLSGALNKVQPKIELIPLEGAVESIRVIKEPGEIELIIKAAEISDKAMEHIRETIHVGMTEKEVAWEIEKFMREKGSQSLPFEAIVASGPNAALPHHRPSERRISPGEPVVIDIGARFGGYCSDLTRTICLERHDSQFNQVYDTVLKAQLAAITMIHEGTSGTEADGAARKVITDAGFGQAFGHSLGHGVGLNEHEQPRLGPNSTDTLVSGMVFTIEPGIYLTGWSGVRIEDLVLLENGKIKLLSKARK